jgi:hypothetical protein
VWSRWFISFPCGSPRRLNCTRPLAIVSQRSDRPLILARYLSTYASGIYRRCPVPSMKFLLEMLKSCDNRTGEEGRHPLSVPGSAVCVPAPDGALWIRDHPLRWRSGPPRRVGGVWLTATRRPLRMPGVRSAGFGGQGDGRPKARGAVTLVGAPDLEADRDEWHVGLGQQSLRPICASVRQK